MHTCSLYSSSISNSLVQTVPVFTLNFVLNTFKTTLGTFLFYHLQAHTHFIKFFFRCFNYLYIFLFQTLAFGVRVSGQFIRVHKAGNSFSSFVILSQGYRSDICLNIWGLVGRNFEKIRELVLDTSQTRFSSGHDFQISHNCLVSVRHKLIRYSKSTLTNTQCRLSLGLLA